MTDRVVLVDPGNYTPFYDLNLAAALSAQGWEVEVMTSAHLFETIPAPPAVRVTALFFSRVTQMLHRWPRLRNRRILRRLAKAASYPGDLRRLDRALAERPAGVLHVQWALLPWVDARFWRRWRARGWTVVYTAHDVRGLAGTTPRPLRLANRRLFRLADRVVVHSSRDRDRVVAAGVPAERVSVVAQGGPGMFHGANVERCEARRALGIDSSRPTILLFGFLKAYKGLGLLLASLARVRDRIPDVLLLIAGEPLTSTRRWDRAIRERNLERHVLWHRSYVPTDRVSQYFAAADVVALPYVSASSSAVLVNAFAHARPVVATDVGATPEMVADGETGIVVPGQDSAGFALALQSLLLAPAKAATMGRSARDDAQRRHGWTCIASETTRLYRAAIEAARTAR